MIRSLQSAINFDPQRFARDISNDDDVIIIGKIGAARGLNGDLKIIPLTDFADRFDDLKEVTVDGTLMKIDGIKYVGGSLFMRFVGYETREAARKLTNKFLTVNRSNAAPLADGEFYTFDIVGLIVYDLEGKRIGEVVNVLKTGSNDVFVTKADDGREILIPALKRVVSKIDIENKTMIVDTKALEEV